MQICVHVSPHTNQGLVSFSPYHSQYHPVHPSKKLIMRKEGTRTIIAHVRGLIAQFQQRHVSPWVAELLIGDGSFYPVVEDL